MERVHRAWIGNFYGGQARRSGGKSPPVGCRGKALVGDLGDEVHQKLKQNGKLVHNY